MAGTTLFSVLHGDRPAVGENWCEYRLLFREPAKAAAALRDRALARARDIYGGHIWQHDPFQLEVDPTAEDEGTPRATTRSATPAAASSNTTPPPHPYPRACLRGRSRFGDNIDDEWLIVHVLAELTRAFDGAVAKVHDNDGQFLLIEAAEHLPPWLSPANSDHRVFLYRGGLHVVAEGIDTSTGREVAQPVNDARAAALVRDDRVSTAASDAMNAAVATRHNVFPDAARRSVHVAHAYLPQRVATLLHRRPQLVADATRAFYLRSSEDSALCSTMARFPPLRHARVASAVKFTRCLFSQLVSQKFHAPKPFKGFMPTADKTNGDGASGSLAIPQSELDAADVGMRLTCGFEIMFARDEAARESMKKAEQGADNGVGASCGSDGGTKERAAGETPAELGDDAETRCEARWALFRARLEKSGFFGGTGSPPTAESLAQARTFFDKQDTGGGAEGPHPETDGALSASSSLPSALGGETISAPVFPHTCAELTTPRGGTDWMQGNDELQARMAAYEAAMQAAEKEAAASRAADGGGGGGGAGLTGDHTADMKTAELLATRLSEEMQHFVETTSGHKGVNAKGAATGDDVGEFSLDLDKLIGILGGDSGGFGGGVTAGAPAAAAAEETEGGGGGRSKDDDASKRVEDLPTARIMEAMEAELQETTMASTYMKAVDGKGGEGKDGAGGTEGLMPLDLDLNLIEGMMESFSAQEGLAGPVSNIMGDLGVEIPGASSATKEKE